MVMCQLFCYIYFHHGIYLHLSEASPVCREECWPPKTLSILPGAHLIGSTDAFGKMGNYLAIMDTSTDLKGCVIPMTASVENSPAASSTEPRWLNPEEQDLWRLLLRSIHRIDRSLDETLQQGEGITASEFAVLVALSEHPEKTMRLKELCAQLEWDRSRTSHQITRMERRGLVTKAKAEHDGRGVHVQLTDEGQRRIEAAAPGHVEVVRKVVFDHMSAEESEVLQQFFRKVLEVKLDAVTDFQSAACAEQAFPER